MDFPVCSILDIIDELADNYRSCFGEVRQFRHFKEIIIANYKKTLKYRKLMCKYGY